MTKITYTSTRNADKENARYADEVTAKLRAAVRGPARFRFPHAVKACLALNGPARAAEYALEVAHNPGAVLTLDDAHQFIASARKLPDHIAGH